MVAAFNDPKTQGRLAMKLMLAIAFVAATSSTLAFGQSASDSAAIAATAHDYIDGWYTADGPRMAKALHPELAKRIVMADSSGQNYLQQMGASHLTAATRQGGGNRTPQAKRLNDVTVLDIYRNAAVAKIVASDWIDYLELAKWNGRWVIVNVLWELKPRGS